MNNDYLNYPTFAQLPRGIRTPDAFIPCPVCGCTHFGFRKSDRAAVCVKCGRIFEHRQKAATVPSVQIAGTFWQTALLRPDGTIRCGFGSGAEQCTSWKNITAIAAAHEHILGLRADGTVAAAGANENGKCNVQDWTNITAIAAGMSHSVGLCSDGTVKAVGMKSLGRCDTQSWQNITAIAASNTHTVGLCRDGTLRSTGNNGGQCNWKNITAIACGAYHTVGLCSDGTVKATELFFDGIKEVQEWRNITAIAAGSSHTVGLCNDGTVKAAGVDFRGCCNVQDWKDITAIFAAEYHTFGLRADGRIVCTNSGLERWLNENLL